MGSTGKGSRNKHISYDKLSKKKQRQIDRLKRGTWYGVKPVTRAPKSSKAYDRREAQDWKKDSGPVLFSLQLRLKAPMIT